MAVSWSSPDEQRRYLLDGRYRWKRTRKATSRSWPLRRCILWRVSRRWITCAGAGTCRASGGRIKAQRREGPGDLVAVSWSGDYLVERFARVIAQPVTVSLTVAADLLGCLAQGLAHVLKTVALAEPARYDES